MEDFWKGTAAVLLAVILALVLDRQQKDLSALLTTAVCALVGAILVSYLEPVVDLLYELEAAGDVRDNFLGSLLKAAGIGLTAELAGQICADAGKASLGKALQMLGSAAILSLSVPVFRSMFAMIQQILGGL
ncbi:MAG: stage III sporulation AC/AD family protein [Eubacteriales bacterium]|nr:stage III sporulation AC/AD family protein [Eubacteriales bacterium]